ncbi:MAG: hypothetical protein M1153_02740, partial [Patescibacteria group bacterium]|nr:hypothetical protein [Patescibacteria group bacterium]
ALSFSCSALTSELEGISKASFVTPELKEKQSRLEAELKSLSSLPAPHVSDKSSAENQAVMPPAEAEKKKATGEPVSALTPDGINKAFEAGKPFEVKVLRTSGEIEGGWQAVGASRDGLVRVAKRGEDGKEIYKEVSLIELRTWNPQENYQELIEKARNDQAATYAAWRAGKKSKKGEGELAELLKNAESSKNSHYELVAKYVSSLIKEKDRELEGDPEKVSKLKSYKAELFNEFFIKEYERSQALEIETFPPKEKSTIQKGVNWWMRQPRWKRFAISTGISLGIGVGTGAIATVSALLVFGGATAMRRWVSGGASVGARGLAELGLKGWNKFFGGEKKGLAYQEREMRGKFSGVSLDEFIKMQGEYAEMRTLAEQREKRRRMGVLAAQIGAGVVTSFALGHHNIDAVAKALHITQGEEALQKAAMGAEHAARGAETEIGSHLPFVGHGGAEHAAGVGGVPEHGAGAVAGASAAENISPADYVQSMDGGSVWSKVSDILRSTKQFDALQHQLEAQGLQGDALTRHLSAAKTYYIDAIKDKVVADPSKYVVDGKLDLSSMFATPGGQTWLHEIAAKAEGLSPADVQNITHSNAVLAEFAVKFPHEQLPSVEVAQQKLAEAVSVAPAHAGAAAVPPISGAEAGAMPTGDFTQATGEAFLNKLRDEELTPQQIASVLDNKARVEQLAQVTNSPSEELLKSLGTGIAKSESIRDWLFELDAGQQSSANITTVLASPEWVNRLATLRGMPAGEMQNVLERALHIADAKELLQSIISGKATPVVIKAAMNNADWVREVTAINNTSPLQMQQLLQAAYEKAVQSGK